eukprot:GHVN01091400.1.p1 GENE.GHVN01091400.1~~GHVN01091400.1.p1  ORF type:complete len:120 (+),score=31.12 GHVN01091400.1:22-360(+)
MGKVRSEGVGEVQEFIDICDLACGLSRQLEGKGQWCESYGIGSPGKHRWSITHSLRFVQSSHHTLSPAHLFHYFDHLTHIGHPDHSLISSSTQFCLLNAMAISLLKDGTPLG